MIDVEFKVAVAVEVVVMVTRKTAVPGAVSFTDKGALKRKSFVLEQICYKCNDRT